MNINKKLLLFSVSALFGICIFVQNLILNYEDPFWNSFGIALASASFMHIYRILKYKKNDDYAKKVNIQNSDERNKFLAERARGAAFGIYIVISGLAIIALRFFKFNYESSILGYSVCALLIFYVVSYFILSKKY